MNEKKYQESSKKKLMGNIKKKFDTTIIGSLAVFEEAFGECWGHGLDPNERTLEQSVMAEKWQEARSKILDNGNSNLRAAQNEISNYTLSFNRYVLKGNLR